MKTAKEIIKETLTPDYTLGALSNQDIVDCMIIYAEQALDEASRKAITIKIGNSGSFFDASVDRESILKIKEQLK